MDQTLTTFKDGANERKAINVAGSVDLSKGHTLLS